MKWIHVKALFESQDISLGEELVSDIFFSLGFTGVVSQVPLESPPEGFGSDALPTPDETSVSGYVPDTDASSETLDNIRKRAKLLGLFSIKVTIETNIVDQQDWAESWKQYFYVTKLTDRIFVRPTWREFEPKPNDIVIDLDPGMAFGTGTHPTTSMCVSLIEKYIAPENKFLDVGTGSGILMIAAAKLGASYIIGLDTDEVAVQVATENLTKNFVPLDMFRVKKATLGEYIKKQHQTIGDYTNGNNKKLCNIENEYRNTLSYQIKQNNQNNQSNQNNQNSLNKQNNQNVNMQFNLIAANIIAEVLVEIMAEIKACLQEGGIAILSGIINDRQPMVIESLNKFGFSIIETRIDGEWVAIAATHS